jgi:hypothetical protein
MTGVIKRDRLYEVFVEDFVADLVVLNPSSTVNRGFGEEIS